MAEQKTIDKVNKLLEGHCWEPLKTAPEEWLQAVGTDTEKEAEEKLIPLLKDGVAMIIMASDHSAENVQNVWLHTKCSPRYDER